MSPYSAHTDEQLLSLLHNGDEDGFAEIYDRYWEPMVRQVLKVLRSPDDARDIAQEIFISIWKRRAELAVRDSLRAYLMKCARNLTLRRIEKEISRQNFLESLTEHTRQLDIPDVSSLELRELERKLDAAIGKLPPKMREVFLLSRMENLSYRQIAQRLGIAENTVKKQVSNALKGIRAEVTGWSATTILLLVFLFQ